MHMKEGAIWHIPSGGSVSLWRGMILFPSYRNTRAFQAEAAGCGGSVPFIPSAIPPSAFRRINSFSTASAVKQAEALFSSSSRRRIYPTTMLYVFLPSAWGWTCPTRWMMKGSARKRQGATGCIMLTARQPFSTIRLCFPILVRMQGNTLSEGASTAAQQ